MCFGNISLQAGLNSFNTSCHLRENLDSPNENQNASKKGSDKKNSPQVNKLFLVPLKAVPKLLPTYEEFVFVTDLGKN